MEGLRVNVAALLKERIGAARDYDVHVPPAGEFDGIRVTAPIEGHVRLLRLTESILAHGDLRTTVEVECSRCLAAVSVPVEVSFDEQYYPQVDVETGVRLPGRADEEGFDIDSSHELDLTEPVRQHVLLALPMQPICREACAGLCPVCGKDWNEGPCEHEVSDEDPRFAALRALLLGVERESKG